MPTRLMLGFVRVSTVLCIVLAAKAAEAACPDRRASCVLHEEGVALFLEKNYEEAAKKFAAAIAAEPTARSYLGYAQAVESLGQIALAYDTMVAAQRLSTAEVQANPKDNEVTSRQERIKYKLGELRAKIGFVWLRLPQGVSPQRVVGVKREGEGDLSQPLTQWTAVAPGRQVLIASIDDGTKVEVVAEVAAGSQGVVVIPLRGRVATNPNPNPNLAGPGPGTGRPLAQLYIPVPKPPQPTYSAYFAVGLSVLTGKPERELESAGPSSGNGTGVTALYERKVGSSWGLATRLELMLHGDGVDEFDGSGLSVKGNEVLMLVGARTFGSRTFHGRAGIGLALYSENVTQNGFDAGTGFTRAYPAFEIGGGLHLGRVRFQMGILYSPAPGDPTIPDLGTRFMGTFAIDLYRNAEPLPAPATPAGVPANAPPVPR